MSRVIRHLRDLDSSGQWERSLIGRCVVANGCFDILHPGHLSVLQWLDSRRRHHNLEHAVVALNSDLSVRELKGSERPIVPEYARAKLLTSLMWEFDVIVYDGDTQQLMDFLKPLVVVKGAEYSEDQVIRYNGSFISIVPMVASWSTTSLVNL